MNVLSSGETERLQIGISDPRFLPDRSIKVFSDGSWINLGEDAADGPRRISVTQSLRSFVSRARRLFNPSLRLKDKQTQAEWAETCERMNVTSCFWRTGSRLPYDDATFSFIFSEHFFEHIFMDEAFDLFVECARVLKPGGTLRISVPDADLRTYAKPEPLKFDARIGKTGTVGWDNPDIHKTRWNIYSLSLLLKLAGLRVVPLVYCDRSGEFFSWFPGNGDSNYPRNADWEMVCTNEYIVRERSLIADAVRLS
jgi:predicted SAM-dependent methyltransferase